MSDQARIELAPTGVLRAGINLSNFLLVTGKTDWMGNSVPFSKLLESGRAALPAPHFCMTSSRNPSQMA